MAQDTGWGDSESAQVEDPLGDPLADGGDHRLESGVPESQRSDDDLDFIQMTGLTRPVSSVSRVARTAPISTSPMVVADEINPG